MAISSNQWNEMVSDRMTSAPSATLPTSSGGLFGGRDVQQAQENRPGFLSTLWTELKKPIVGLGEDLGYLFAGANKDVQAARQLARDRVVQLRAQGREDEARVIEQSEEVAGISAKKWLGDIGGTALTIASIIPGANVVGILGRIAPGLRVVKTLEAVARAEKVLQAAKASGIARDVQLATKALQVAKAGTIGKYANIVRTGIEGLGWGGAQGTASAMSDDDDIKEILKRAGYGALLGGGIGAAGTGAFALVKAGLSKTASLPIVNKIAESEVSQWVADHLMPTGSLIKKKFGEAFDFLGRDVVDLIETAGYNHDAGLARYAGVFKHSLNNLEKKFGKLFDTSDAYKAFEDLDNGIAFNSKSKAKLNRYLYYKGDLLPDEAAPVLGEGKQTSGFGFYSPNIEENLTFDDAVKALDSERHNNLAAVFDDIDKATGIEGTNYTRAVGDWSDGAENTIMKEITGDVSWENIRLNAAMKGKAGNQKAVLPFIADEAGEDSVYTLVVKDTMENVRKNLDAQNIKYRTLVSEQGGQVRIAIYDQGTALADNVEKLGQTYGQGKAQITKLRGRGEFLGGDTRAEGLQKYEAVISESKARGVGKTRPEGKGIRDRDLGAILGRIAPDGQVGYTAREGVLTVADLPESIQDILPRDVVRTTRDEIAAELTKRGYQVKVFDPATGGTVWKPFEEVSKDFVNYKPHIVPNASRIDRYTNKFLRDGTYNPDRYLIIRQAVDDGYFKTFSEAEKTFDDWVNVLKTKGIGITKQNQYVQFVMKTRNVTEKKARQLILKERESLNSVKLGSNIERERYIDHPFYSPYQDETALEYVSDSLRRVEQGAQLGYNPKSPNEFAVLDKSMEKIRDYLGGDTVAAEEAVKEFKNYTDIMLRRVNHGERAERVSLFVRMLGVPKLAFAQIINLGQSMNTLLATDMPSFLKGIGQALTKNGRQFTGNTGATIQTVVNEAINPWGAGEFADSFLRATGFVGTEKLNRTIASNTFRAWATKNFEALQKYGVKQDIRSFNYINRLKELGIDPLAAIKRGKLTNAELLRAAQIGSGKTQFLSRPGDLPYWASTPVGKAFFQFKNFAYQQTTFLKREIGKEMAAGNYGRVARAISILATLFPMTGEVLQDIRSLATQKQRPTKILDRYLDDLVSAGSLAIIGDFIQSSQYGDIEFTAPAGSAVLDVAQPVFASSRDLATGNLDKVGNDMENLYKAVLRQMGLPQPYLNLTAKRKKGYDSSLESLDKLFFE